MTKRDLLSMIYEYKTTTIRFIAITVLLTAIVASRATRRKMIRKQNNKTIDYIDILAKKFEKTVVNQKRR